MSNYAFFDDFLATYVRICSNPVALILFVLGNFDLILQLLNPSKSIYGFLVERIQTYLTSAPEIVQALLENIILLLNFLVKYRNFLAPQYLIYIPVVLSERDLIVTTLIGLLAYLVIGVFPLERLYYSHVWLHFNSLKNIHKFILLIITTSVVYFNVIDFNHKAFVNFLRNVTSI